jgi:hypothetical protein
MITLQNSITIHSPGNIILRGYHCADVLCRNPRHAQIRVRQFTRKCMNITIHQLYTVLDKQAAILH